MKNFLSLLKREFKLFWGNHVLRLLFIGAPILYGILLGYVYSKGKVTDLPVVVIDQDHSSMSRKIIEMLNESEAINVSMILMDKSDLEQNVVQQEATSTVVIPKDFEKDVLTGRNPEILNTINTSNVLTANYSAKAVQTVLGTIKAGIQMETLRKKGTPEALLMSSYEPFKTTLVKKYNRSGNYMYYLWPGVLATVLQQVLMLGLALSFASEYESGTFKELTEKTSILGMILVKILPYMIMSIGIWLMYWGFTFWFRIPVNENMGALTLIAGIFVVAVCFIGILVSILFPNQLEATEVLMVIATPSFIISGFTWPLSQMPIWVQAISNCIPLTQFLKAFRILLVEKGTISQTYPMIWAMVLIAFVCGIASVVALYFKRKKVLA